MQTRSLERGVYFFLTESTELHAVVVLRDTRGAAWGGIEVQIRL